MEDESLAASDISDSSVKSSRNSRGSSIASRRSEAPVGLGSIVGLVSLEIVAAQNLPRERKYDINPFVVISFGKQTFRTKAIKDCTDPVWKEELCLYLFSRQNTAVNLCSTVRDYETNYYVMFSVYDYDKFGFNSCIATTNIRVHDIMEAFDRPQNIALTLNLHRAASTAESCLLVKGHFTPYESLRRNFWCALAKLYDHDENGKLNIVEFSTMLESIGSTLSEATLKEISQRVFHDQADNDIPFDKVADCLEHLTVTTGRDPYESTSENIMLFHECPICGRRLTHQKLGDIDVITHLAICAAKDEGKVDRIVMGGFLTEEYASRKWVIRLLSFMSFGGYRIGKNNGNIFVQDRRTGKILEEKMPTYIRLGIRMLHQNLGGSRAVDFKMMKQLFQTLTIKQGKKFNDPASAKYIPNFIAYHKIVVSEILEPIGSFKTFNEFFHRKLKPDARFLASADPRVAVSPADSRINCYPQISDATRLWIKGTNFSIANLLKDENLARCFDGGSLVLCRLAPQDYHRFHSPVDGRLNIFYYVPGTYYTVNPMAVRQRVDVLTENVRTVCLIDSDCFGRVALVAIGALMVGSIVMTCGNGGVRISRMDELGYFAFGGSSVVLLFPKDSIKFDEDLILNSEEQLETLVHIGNSIGNASNDESMPESQATESSD